MMSNNRDKNNRKNNKNKVNRKMMSNYNKWKTMIKINLMNQTKNHHLILHKKGQQSSK